MKHPFGYILIFLSLFITLLLWYLAKDDIVTVISSPIESFIEICALLGTVLMALSIILSTRVKIITTLFGGLDKNYKVHALIGTASLLLLLAHPILLTFDALMHSTPVLQYYVLGYNLAYNFGILSFYSLLFSVIFMAFVKLPYHLWKYTHQLLVFTFLFGGLHGFLAASDIATYVPLQIWMLVVFTVGGVSGVYVLFLANRFGKNYHYVVTQIRNTGDVVEVYLSPCDQAVQFSPGEFIFARFHNKALGKEIHPFSISSTVSEKTLRLSVKMVGDYTQNMTKLTKGDAVDVYGPFGTFGNIYKKITPHMIWIAGGIGVTPFLSMLREEAVSPQPGSINFFYTHHSSTDGTYRDEIVQLVSHTPRVKFFEWNTQNRQRLTGKQVGEIVPNYKECIILLCGPRVMMQTLEKQFLALGVTKEHILYEDFSFL